MTHKKIYVLGKYGEHSQDAKYSGATGQSPGYPVFVIFEGGDTLKTTECAWFIQREHAKKFADMMNLASD